MDDKTKNHLDDLEMVIGKHYDPSEEGSLVEATWHQQWVLLEIAKQLAEMNTKLGDIANLMMTADLERNTR